MSTISRLPDSAARLLGSPLVITTPVTLVKELLDNAIDARATSVEVIVSSNTISKIEVRDNGVGIHPDDYDSLGRRGHTSKLRSFEESRTHVGKTLGFRGEALAAANTVAKVAIITKTSDDPVGATLRLVSDIGGVAQHQKTSAPIGTTVRITELFGRLPVREQVVTKESTKTLDKIRDLLQSYAMARPTLKLALKVLQNPKQNWSYSPKRNADVGEAVLQIFGKEVSAHCFEKIFLIDGPWPEARSPDDDESASRTNSYTFEAYIVDPGANPCRVPKHHFFSVDGRPVSAKRGTMKKILDIYVKALDAKRDGLPSEQCRGHFIRLNIVCPSRSYDANIEPCKNEVLFTDEQFLLDGFEGLCTEVYNSSEARQSALQDPARPWVDSLGEAVADGGTTPMLSPTAEAHSHDSPTPIFSNTVNDGGSSGAPHVVDNQHTPFTRVSRDRHPLPQWPHRGTIATTAFTPINSQAINSRDNGASPESTRDRHTTTGIVPSQRNVNMSADLNEHVEDNHRRKRAGQAQSSLGSLEESEDATTASMRGLNPWLIAKMNAPARPQEPGSLDLPEHAPLSSNEAFQPPLTPEPPLLRHLGAPPGDLDLPPSQRLTLAMSKHREGNDVPGGRYRSPMSSPAGLPPRRGLGSTLTHPNRIPRRRHPQPPWTPPSSIRRPSNLGAQQYSSECNEASDGFRQTKITVNKKRGIADNPRPQHRGGIWLGPNCSPTNLYSGPSYDIENAFSSARAHLSQQLPQDGISTPNNQRNELRKPFNQLRSINVQLNAQPPIEGKEPIKTTLPPGDPRAYLLRRQKSAAAEISTGAGPKLRRLKSSLMPLENVPTDHQTHSLVLRSDCNIQQLFSWVKQVQPYDKYMTEGELEAGIDMSLDEGRRVEARLKALLPPRAENNSGEGEDVELNLGSLLKGKGPSIEI
ncbi:hypothetical protein DL766_010310 [Monosporascus sp. MC13-8B]|uniref:DNA mismatch repair protein S5 domain-containing protein n=1 Tax=Monosporascus cannonballus TaxID=155416 RepID=A0ABY0GX21_9PEZI|nr:hypothetical protein DL762_008468 [Monosporascus cannonballus]RYO83896.1 hypothetical protein DL763_007668 [Monosporascus cannonballus]RYP02483.1 hypothetical protein DL766_010310 [Monosporascus sp. MC13-8B]